MKPVIFFDWDGTLADSMNLCVAEIRQALITMRLPDLPDDVLRQCNGPTFEQSLDILHIPHDRAQEYMTTRLNAELALVPTVNRLFPGVREMLLLFCTVITKLQALLERRLNAHGFQ